MKKVLVYWIIGCLILGFSWGLNLRACAGRLDPAKSASMGEKVAGVAIWPAIAIAAYLDPIKTRDLCDRSTP